MARTKASVGAKVSSGKSSKARCCAAPAPSSSSSSSGSGEKSSRSLGGGNPVCPQPTPKWQKPITNFFIGKSPEKRSEGSDNEDTSSVSAGTSKSKKRNVIESDEEEEVSETTEKPVNTALDETIELEPLTGDASHKIEEYYPKNGEVEVGDGEVETVDEGKSPDKQNETKEDSNKVVKGKGRGKKTNKENVNNNQNNKEKRKSVKRDLDSSQSEEETVNVSKKVKV